jgi:uncharacterized protein (TIGR03032 family)
MNQQTQNPPPPFSYTFSPNVPELLLGLNSSIAITTYQTGKVVIFSAQDNDRLIQLPRNFPRPMGMDIKAGKWAIALQNEVLVTANSPSLVANYPPNPGTYDGLFVPRASHYTGPLDLHDLAWGKNDKLYAVNTLFSCLSEFSYERSFEPIWQPNFITKLMPEDRCHLNGLALENSEPRYVTALGKHNESRGWKPKMLTEGILMDVPSNEIIATGLPTPHSPRLYDDGLYMLLSATGEVVRMDPETGKYDVITQLNGFLRGMDRVGDYLFIAMSKLRQHSSIFKEAPIAQKSVVCGISIVYIPTGAQAGYILYNTSVEELFEVKVLNGFKRPNILNVEKGVHAQSITTEEGSFWLTPPQQTTESSTDQN